MGIIVAKKVVIALVMFLLVISPIFALTISPEQMELRDPQGQKKMIITAINPDAGSYDVQVVVQQSSLYLSPYIGLEPQQFTIGPNEKKNVLLTIDLPANLSPETHNLGVAFFSGSQELGSFKATFTVSGERLDKLILTDARAIVTGDIVYFDLSLQNDGNVLATGSPIVKIALDTGEMSFGEESRLTIAPGTSYNVSLMYDASALPAGTYPFTAKVSYNGLETEKIKGQFVIQRQDGIENGTARVGRGKRLSYPVILDNPGGKETFYRVTYAVAGKTESVEGSFSGIYKELMLDIDTTGLTEGAHDLDIETKTGLSLEKSENIAVKLQVTAFPLWAFAPLAVLPIIASYYLFRRKRHAPDLDKEMSELRKSYDNLELSLKALSKDVHGFINDSNGWLKANGFQHGFR